VLGVRDGVGPFEGGWGAAGTSTMRDEVGVGGKAGAGLASRLLDAAAEGAVPPR